MLSCFNSYLELYSFASLDSGLVSLDSLDSTSAYSDSADAFTDSSAI